MARSILLLLALILFTACGRTAGTIATAVAGTRAAEPTPVPVRVTVIHIAVTRVPVTVQVTRRVEVTRVIAVTRLVDRPVTVTHTPTPVTPSLSRDLSTPPPTETPLPTFTPSPTYTPEPLLPTPTAVAATEIAPAAAVAASPGNWALTTGHISAPPGSAALQAAQGQPSNPATSPFRSPVIPSSARDLLASPPSR